MTHSKLLCIAGKNLIAVQALASLSREYQVVALPNPDDDGSQGWQPSFRATAEGVGVPIVSLEDLYPRKELCFLSLEYANIIRPERFASSRLFNVHFSLLPLYRGCNTAIWPILNGEAEHGSTLHEIDPGVDTGAVIDQRAFSLVGMTAFDAYMSCQRVGLDLALEWTPRLMAGNYTATPQGEGSTYPRKMLDYGWRNLDLSQTAEEVVRRARAFTFPAYQRPAVDDKTVYEASLDPGPGLIEFAAADRPVFLRLTGAAAQ